MRSRIKISRRISTICKHHLLESLSTAAYLQTHAWSACNQILNDAQSLVVCTFAAQTMRRKMVSDFRELDPASYTTIRQSLLNHLWQVAFMLHLMSIPIFSVVKQKFDANTQPIVTQLAVALIDLYLQVPEWNEFGVELFNQFAKYVAQCHLSSCILMLIV